MVISPSFPRPWLRSSDRRLPTATEQGFRMPRAPAAHIPPWTEPSFLNPGTQSHQLDRFASPGIPAEHIPPSSSSLPPVHFHWETYFLLPGNAAILLLSPRQGLPPQCQGLLFDHFTRQGWPAAPATVACCHLMPKKASRLLSPVRRYKPSNSNYSCIFHKMLQLPKS